MTSRISFLNLTKESIKRGAAFGVLLLVGFFCYYPVGTLLLAESGRVKGILASKALETVGFYLIENPFLFFITGAAAVTLGIMQFWYLHSQDKTDLYHSLPVRRETLFAVQYAAGVLLWLVPFAGNLLLAFFLCLIKGIGFSLLSVLLTGLLAHIACFLLPYSLSVLAMMLTGKFFAALSGIAVFFCYVPALTALKVIALEYYFTTYYSEMSDSRGFRFTPLYLVWNVSEGMMDGQFPLLSVLIAFFTAVLVSLVCVFLYRIRPCEKAGTSMVFSVMARVVKFLLVVPSAIAGATFFYIIGNESRVWGFFGWIFALLLVSAVIEFVYRMDIREVLSDRKQLFFTGAVTLAVVCILQFDLFGYDKWLPDEDQLEAICVDSIPLTGQSRVNFYEPSQEEWYTYTGESAFEEMDSDTTAEGNYYEISHTEYTKFICTEDQIGDMLNVIRQSNTFTGNDVIWSDMHVVYRMKDGSEKKRHYYYYEDMDEMIAPLWENGEQKKKMYPILSVKPDEIYAIQINTWYSGFHFVPDPDIKELTDAQQKKVLETFQKELRDASYEEFMEDSTDNINFVYRTQDGKLQGEPFCLDRAFPETRKLLETYGYELTDEIS